MTKEINRLVKIIEKQEKSIYQDVEDIKKIEKK